MRRQSWSELLGSEPKQVHDLGGRDEGIGDRGAVGDRQSGDRAVVQLGDQRRAGGRWRGVELGQVLKLLMIARGGEANDDGGHTLIVD